MHPHSTPQTTVSPIIAAAAPNRINKHDTEGSYVLPKTELESGCRRASIASVCASLDLGKHPELFLERIRESIGGSNLRLLGEKFWTADLALLVCVVAVSLTMVAG